MLRTVALGNGVALSKHIKNEKSEIKCGLDCLVLERKFLWDTLATVVEVFSESIPKGQTPILRQQKLGYVLLEKGLPAPHLGKTATESLTVVE